MGVNLRALISKPNNVVQAAAGLRVSRTHCDLEVEHYLLKLLDITNSDFSLSRNIHNILTHMLLPDISRRLLSQIAEGEKPHTMHVGIGDDGGFTYF